MEQVSVASVETFSRDPHKFWGFARELGSTFLNAKPNAAHEALAELEHMKRLDCLITQNIDGLHQHVGSRHTIEIHGSLRRITCTRCDATYATDCELR